MNRLKVLFHINEPDRWQRVLVNITNFLNDVGQGNAEVEVVANGEAVSVFRSSCVVTGDGSQCCGPATGSLMEQMKKLSDSGVKFTACRNALKAQSIDEGRVPDFVRVVPAGITEIAKRQTEGYAYIKP